MAEYLTLDDAAERYGVKRKTVRMWARRGHIALVARSDGQEVVDAAALAFWWDEERDARMDEVRRGLGAS